MTPKDPSTEQSTPKLKGVKEDPKENRLLILNTDKLESDESDIVISSSKMGS